MSTTRQPEIAQADTPEQIALCQSLFGEYAAGLNVDLCFQGFVEELANLPGAYAPPRGRLLLATWAGQPAGCVALRPLAEGICEMKRLYVKPEFRRHGLGRQLVARIIEEAQVIGYGRMRLDTLSHLQPALRLYEQFGFARCAPYYDTPLTSTVFLELNLAGGDAA